MDLFTDAPGHDRVRGAIAAIAAGKPVVVVDDVDRENEGDLIFAASCATPTLVAFTVRHTSGFLCVAVPDEECDRLGLAPMHHSDGDRFGTAYAVSVDVVGSGTGISAASRSATIAALGAPTSTPRDFVRPGHVVPLRARQGGVLDRPGHTEAAVDLARLAGLHPAGALCEIVSEDNPSEMARGAELELFAERHGLPLISVADLISYRRHTEPQVRRVVETGLPTEHGHFQAIGYLSASGAEHVALTAGPIDDSVPVHVHVECLSGDVLRATGCACRRDLDAAMTQFAAAGCGVIVYLRLSGGARACSLLQPVEITDADHADAEWMLADLGARARTVAESTPARIDEWAARRRPDPTPDRIAG